MKKLVVLAALAFALGTVHQAVACDWGMHAADATPIVAACEGNNCATKPTTQEAAATIPEPAAPKVACENSACATDEPTTPVSVVVACDGGCN
jgi:hypothetical protein